MTATVALLSLGRKQGMGEARRVDSLRAIFEAAGASVEHVALLADHHLSARRPPALAQATDVVFGRAMAENLAWSLPSVRRTLRDLRPDAVVSITARAFHPALRTSAPLVILDYVDRLAASYRDRSAVEQSLGRRWLYRALASTSARFEGGRPREVRRIAAGWSDAALLDAEWVPNVIEIPREPAPDERPAYDVLFFGNLAYPPNVSAVRLLAELWPDITARRPGTSVLVAGANPAAEVRATASRLGWKLRAAFDDVVTLCRSARVAVAPLIHAAGIQNKVLEGAAAGVAQVATPQAVAGFKPPLPIRVAEGGAFADAVVDLLNDDRGRAREAAAAHDHVAAHYVPAAWADWAAGALAGR
jgi:hypothetical protein